MHRGASVCLSEGLFLAVPPPTRSISSIHAYTPLGCSRPISAGCLLASLCLSPPPGQVFGLLDKGAHIYFCGLKGMMPGIQAMLERVSKEKGLNFDEFVEKLRKSERLGVSRVLELGDGFVCSCTLRTHMRASALWHN